MPQSGEKYAQQILSQLRTMQGFLPIAGGAPMSLEFSLEEIANNIGAIASGIFTPASISAGLTPATDNLVDIGSSTKRWRRGYFGPGTVAAPSVSVGTANKGLYEAGANELGVSVSGALAAVFGAGYLSFGAIPAAVGTIRLPNNVNIAWRNATNSAEFTFGLDSSNIINLLNGLSGGGVTLYGGHSSQNNTFTIGNRTSGQLRFTTAGGGGNFLFDNASGGMTINVPITISDTRNFALSTGTGTKIGTAATQKLGFWNATPVVQPTKVNDPSGGGTQDAESRTAIAAIIDRLEAVGMFASV